MQGQREDRVRGKDGESMAWEVKVTETETETEAETETETGAQVTLI